MNTAIRILAAALMVLVGILAIGTTPTATVLAFAAAALTFASVVWKEKR